MKTFEQKKRFMRQSMHIGTKGLTEKDIDNFWEGIKAVKKKHEVVC